MATDHLNPNHGMSNFQMLSEDDLKGAGPASKPSLMTRIRNRPLASAAIIGSIVIALVLVIALPAALVGKDDESSGSGSSSGSSGSNSGSGSGSGSGGPSSTSSSTPSRPTKGTGCGTPHTVGYSNGKSSHNIKSSGTNRYYTMDVPENYNDAKSDPWPLILDFHGAGKSAADQYNNSQYFAEKRGNDYLIVYPEGLGGLWESAGYARNSADDLAFVSDLLDHLDTTYCIDPERVYASGKSNGGGFVDLLACSDEGDSFSAYAMAAAALYSDTKYKPDGGCDKARPILEVHGGKDSTVSYEGGKGKGGESPDIEEWLKWWSRRNGCKKRDDPTTEDFKDYNLTSYSCDGYDDIVQGYYIPDLNHCWPSADGNNSDAGARENGCAFRDMDFTSLVLDWFERWNGTSAPKN